MHEFLGTGYTCSTICRPTYRLITLPRLSISLPSRPFRPGGTEVDLSRPCELLAIEKLPKPRQRCPIDRRPTAVQRAPPPSMYSMGVGLLVWYLVANQPRVPNEVSTEPGLDSRHAPLFGSHPIDTDAGIIIAASFFWTLFTCAHTPKGIIVRIHHQNNNIQCYVHSNPILTL